MKQWMGLQTRIKDPSNGYKCDAELGPSDDWTAHLPDFLLRCDDMGHLIKTRHATLLCVVVVDAPCQGVIMLGGSRCTPC